MHRVIARRQMRAKFQSHRLVLRGIDILLKQRPADIRGVEAQTRRAPTRRPQTAELHPHEILARRFDPNPAIVQRAIVRDDIHAHFVGDAAALVLLLEAFPPPAAQIEGRPMRDLALRLRPEPERFGEHGIGRGQIFFHVRRREREDRADALNAMPIGIFGQAGRIGEIEGDT